MAQNEKLYYESARGNVTADHIQAGGFSRTMDGTHIILQGWTFVSPMHTDKAHVTG